jgi:homoserine dehydrogenase
MNTDKSDIGIGLVGLGVIGTGVAKALFGKTHSLSARAGRQLVLRKIAEVDTDKQTKSRIDKALFTTKFDDILNDPQISIVVELIGGEHPAYEFIRRSLEAKKHVVTANKEVIAKHGTELQSIAKQNHVALQFEASVGGGIPLIAPFKRDLVANDILTIKAIVNGTTNYILTQMSQENLDFDVALKQAQKLGYAEANPANDIEGLDATYKLAILATIAFGIPVNPKDIYCEGISKLKARDFRYAHELNYAIKLLAIAKRSDNEVEVRVHPVFIPKDSLIAKVNGVYNAIAVEGDLVGQVIFYGQGAGPSPTSSAVIADIINIAQRSIGQNGNYEIPFQSTYRLKPMSNVEARYYMRMSVFDRAGVLAQISKVLGDNAISISSVIQKESDPATQSAEIVIMTHPAKEQAVQQALEATRHLSVVKEISNFVRVED